MRLFVTGFGPFHETADDPSGKLAEATGLPFRVLPVSYAEVGGFLDTLDADSFDVLLMLGMAPKRDRMTPELFGRNYRGKFADVDGPAPVGEIEANGPLLVASTLWSPELLSLILLDDRFRESMDAGEYLCNDITYRALRRFPARRVGFLHVPPVEQMPFDVQLDALKFVIDKIAMQ